jgi:hypothetical protein
MRRTTQRGELCNLMQRPKPFLLKLRRGPAFALSAVVPASIRDALRQALRARQSVAEVIGHARVERQRHAAH